MKKALPYKEARIPFTPEGFRKLEEERKEYLRQRPEAVEHLRKAREMGDLSENGYYKASRQRLSFLDSRIRRVERLIRLALIVETSHGETITIGSVVLFSDAKGQHTYTIVGGYESDPSKGLISHISPLGKAMLGKKKGDSMSVTTPRGTNTYTILHVQ